jgi:hypothetical protein
LPAGTQKYDPRRTLHHPGVSPVGARRIRLRASSQRIIALPEICQRGSLSHLEAVHHLIIPAGLLAGTDPKLDARRGHHLDLSQYSRRQGRRWWPIGPMPLT